MESSGSHNGAGPSNMKLGVSRECVLPLAESDGQRIGVFRISGCHLEHRPAVQIPLLPRHARTSSPDDCDRAARGISAVAQLGGLCVRGATRARVVMYRLDVDSGTSLPQAHRGLLPLDFLVEARESLSHAFNVRAPLFRGFLRGSKPPSSE
jgi:hypothetical protein